MKRISLSDERGTWLGSCILSREGHIDDCPVILGEDAHRSDEFYRRIEDLIARGKTKGHVGPYGYELYDAFERMLE